jgi:phosphorylcholine metabolism protein LicD
MHPDKFKIIYSKSPHIFKDKVKKIFLKILVKIFPKKNLIYRNYIRLLIEKINFNILFILTVIYLRFRYPLFYRLPSRQILAFHEANKFLLLTKSRNINFFLLEGCLLGAVRQGCFAGRPKDIDLGIKESEVQSLLDATPLLIKAGAKSIKKEQANNIIEKIHITFPLFLIDIAIYRKKIINNQEVWYGEPENKTDTNYNGVAFPQNDLDHLITVKAYGKVFLSPSNPKLYLEKIYGKNWKIPDKKQFFYNTK